MSRSGLKWRFHYRRPSTAAVGTLRQSYDDENVTVSAYYVRNCGSSNKMLKHFVLVADDTASRLRKCLIGEYLAY